ncbi:MAG: tetratricopeptide repeat protein [Archangium sp.]|nr:tetratricopeptide repeat protein [Archangium sp.]
MASWKRTSRLLLSVALVVLPCSTWAEPVDAQAKRIALEGKKAFDTGDFATAIARYETAYRLKPAPNLLFNLGQCHRKSGALDEALSYFRRFLETNPPQAQAEATQQVIGEVEAQRAAQREAAEAKAKADEQARLDEMRVAAARAEADAAARKLQLELTRREELPPPPPPVTTRWWFWTGVAVVVAAGVTTAAVVATSPRPVTTTFPDINAR